MKLRKLLLMGKYDSITGKVIKDIFSKMREASKVSFTDSKKSYKGYPIYKETDDIKSLFESERQGIYIDTYSDNISDINFELYLKFAITETGVDRGKYFIDGYAASEEILPYIEVLIAIHPSDGNTIYSKLQPMLRDIIRHEIEHLTQRGWNEKFGKWQRRNFKIRDKIQNNPDNWYKYFLLKDEIDANIHGLYSKAKTVKKPFQNIVDIYLNGLVNDKIITEKQKLIIYKAWKARIPKIGGIPNLK